MRFEFNKIVNIVTKGEIAHYEQLPHLSKYFWKSSAAEASKYVCMTDKVKIHVGKPIFGGYEINSHEWTNCLPGRVDYGIWVWCICSLPFPIYRSFQTTFENIVAKGEIAHDEQFLLWPQYFQLYLMIKLSFMEIFQVFFTMFSKSSAADFACIIFPQCCIFYLIKLFVRRGISMGITSTPISPARFELSWIVILLKATHLFTWTSLIYESLKKYSLI